MKTLGTTVYTYYYVHSLHYIKIMDIRAYLDRIGFSGSLPLATCDLATLARLQSCHQQEVPWENLDTMTGVKFDLT